MTMKLVKTAAALALGASVITSAVVTTDASAASKYKVKSGKLVVSKTGKVAKGFVTYNKLVYKDGKKLTGLKGKVYYKAGKKATGEYKGTYYVKGAKKVTTGTYNGAYYVKGKKVVATGIYNKEYYAKGKKATGTYKEVYYVNGVKKATTGTYNGAYYVKGKKVVTTGLHEEKYYVKGKVATGLVVYQEKLYKDGALNTGLALVDGKLYDGAELNTGIKAYAEQDAKELYYDGAELAEGTFLIDGNEEAFEQGVKVGAKVSSVTAVDATTLEIKFNKAVQEKAALAANIMLEDKKVHASSLSEDGRTLTVITSEELVLNNATVVVPAIATKADEKVLTEKFVTLYSFKDSKAPEFVKVENVNTNKVKAVFSEKIDLGTVTVKDSKGAVVKMPTPTVKDATVEFDLTGLTEGETYTVTIVDAKDKANNKFASNIVTFDMTKAAADKVAPKLTSLKQTGAKTFVIEFDKEISKAGTVNVNGDTAAVEAVKDSKTAFTVTAPAVLNDLTTVTTENFENIDGVGSAFTSQVETFVKDVVAPTVASSKIVEVFENDVNVQYLQVTFDKAVELGTVDIEGTHTDGYVDAQKVDEKAVAASFAKDEKGVDIKNVVLIPVTFATVLNDQYELTFKNNKIQSEAGVAVKDFTASFVKTAPSEVVTPVAPKENVVQVKEIKVKNNSEITVVFDGKLDGASAKNLANYTVSGSEIASVSLAAYDTADQTQTVTIKLVAGTNKVTMSHDVTVKNIKAEGSTKTMLDTVKQVTLNENVALNLVSAKLSSANTKEVIVTFDDAVKVANLVAATVEAEGTSTAVNTTAAIKGKTVIMTFENALTTADLAKLSITGTVTDDSTNETIVKTTVSK